MKPYIPNDGARNQSIIAACTEILHLHNIIILLVILQWSHECYCPIQLQDDVDNSEVNDEDLSDEDVEDKEPNNFNPGAVAVILIAVVICVAAFGGAMWWTYGNGRHCPSILRGYEPVAGTDSNTLADEFLISSDVP